MFKLPTKTKAKTETTMDLEKYLKDLSEETANKILAWKSRERYASMDNWYDTVPEFNETYRRIMKEHFKVRVHAEVDTFPRELLRTKAPNQSPAEWEYQKGIYEPYTNSKWDAARNRTKVIANKQNYSIKGWDENQREYFYKDYPVYGNIEAYFFDIVRSAKIDYPNQVLLIEPLDIPGSWEPSPNDEDELIFIADDTVEIEPICNIIEEKNIIRFRENKELFYVICWERGKLLFRYVDKDAFWEMKQVGLTEDKKPKFDIRKIYSHNLGCLPAKRLQGRPTIHEGQLLYLSYFTPAIADLNDVIRLSSNLMMSSYAMLFNVRIALVDKCKYRNEKTGDFCNGGQVFDTAKGENTTCPACNGSGRSNHHSPTGVYEVIQPDSPLDQNTLAMSPPVQFAGPDTAIYTKVEETILNKKESAFSFLTPKKNTTGKSATESENEKEDAMAFMAQFSNELFDLMEFGIDAIGKMRYPTAFVEPEINRPTSFSFMTNAEITDEIGKARETNLPQSYTQQLVYEAANTRFNSSPETEKYIAFCMKVDGLWNMSPDQVRANINITVSPTDAILHDRITYLIQKCESENPKFWDMKFSDQEDMLKTKAAEIAAILAPKLSTGIAAELGMGGNGLKESVGGLTGMIEIAKAVASGLYDLDAAVALVSDRFGLTEEQARRQLGTPQLNQVEVQKTVDLKL